MNETHHWTTVESRNMADAILRNLGKSRDGASRALGLTNAHSPGANSVGETDMIAWQQQCELAERGEGKITTPL